MTSKKSERGTAGVTVCAVTDGASVRLVFDDVRAATASYPQTWQAHCFFTETTVDRLTFEQCQFTERQLSDIGLAIVTRLAAFAKNKRPSDG
jgi:hypothetical protein